MEIQTDFKELLELLNTYNVEYMIVGGYALAFHGAPRYTGDLDIFVKPDKENARRILDALDEFGFGAVGIELSDLEYGDKVIQLGVPPVRIDIITSISGVTWDDASSSKIEGQYGDVPVYYIGLDQLIKNKKSIGRKKDMADLEALGVD